MDFLREFRGSSGEPESTEIEEADDGWSPPTAEWRPSPERVLGLAELVVGSEPSRLQGMDSFVGPAELEAAARGSWTPTTGWGAAPGESDGLLAPGPPAASLTEAAGPHPGPDPWPPDTLAPALPGHRGPTWDRPRSERLLSLVPAEVLLALAATIVSIVVITLIAIH
jgi:hypothetical protein